MVDVNTAAEVAWSWPDLTDDIVELFGDVRFERVNYGISTTRALHDPHVDADRWLEASEEERDALAPIYEAKLSALRVRNAQALVKVPPKSSKRPTEVQAARMREYRKKKTEERQKEREARGEPPPRRGRKKQPPKTPEQVIAAREAARVRKATWRQKTRERKEP